MSNTAIGRLVRLISVITLWAACLGQWSPAYSLPKERSLDQCRLDVWMARDGLPASEITSIAQTPDGFIWLATSNGLVRFDGSNFAVFDSRNTPGLTTDLVRSLAVRKDGTLWIGTEWDGFGPFVNGRFSPVWPPHRHWHRIPAMQELPDGSIIASVMDTNPSYSGVWRYDGVHVSQQSNAPASAFARSAGGMILSTIGQGIDFVGPNGKIIQSKPILSLTGKTMTSIAIGRDGSVWYGTDRDGLIRICNGKATAYSTVDGLSSNKVNCLFEDHEGCIWIGTNNGIDKWDGKRFVAFGKSDGLYASNVRAISEDREGDLWVASGFGLNRFAATKLIPFSITRNSIVAAVTSISASADGAVWCTSDLGLWKLLPSGAVHYAMPPGLPRDYADDICVAPDGRSLYLWFRGLSNGSELYQVPAPSAADALPATSRRLAAAAPLHPLAIIDEIRSIADADGITVFSQGVMTRLQHGIVVDRRMTGAGYEFKIFRDTAGTFWIGCTNGLVRVRNGVATLMNAGLPPETHVLGIDQSDSGCLWLATDKGLARFRNGRSTLYSLTAGLPDSNLFQIARDRSGLLWIGCLHGLFTVRIADIDAFDQRRLGLIPYSAYSAADGIRSYFNLFSTEKTPDGRLWFSGDNGVTMVDPAHVTVNNFPPPVAIENAVMDRTILDCGRSITVPPGDGRLHVVFAALSFTAPEQVRFRYRLEGFDNGWVDSSRRSADYTNLPPGTYRFVVTACNNDGIWNSVGSSVSFRLEPHYYQTIWFRVIAVVATIALVVFGFTWRMRRVVRQNQQLELLIAKRTAELRHSNDQLQYAQEELTAQNHELETARDYLEHRVAERTSELENAYNRTIEGWSYVMDLRDKETEGHSRRVTDVTVRMGEAIGLSEDEIDNARRGALLHDIGKMGIPDSVLLKPGPLTDEEWKVMRMHPVYAYEILSQIDYLKSAIDIPWCHHEKWDGSGYPRGLKGEEIPLTARMFSIVDVWDALRSDRPYRSGWPEEKVFAHLRSLSGTQFEPSLVDLFFTVMSANRDGDADLEQRESKAA